MLSVHAFAVFILTVNNDNEQLNMLYPFSSVPFINKNLFVKCLRIHAQFCVFSVSSLFRTACVGCSR